MSQAFWTKFFYFSASYSRLDQTHGHNFTLGVTVEYSDKMDEATFINQIEVALVQKIHSRDLSMHVDFLKNIEITDYNLLKIFSEIISRQIKPVKLHSVSLERDPRTKLLLLATDLL